jgi:AcrR family transcriptional regulator
MTEITDSHFDVPDLTEPDPREPPRTARGLRTRAALVAAARTIFERDGYLHARLTDITAEADCSTGSFYTYFASKEEIFAAVLKEAQEEMLHPQMDQHSDDVVATIEATNRAYLEAYRRNARLMALLEQVASIDANFRRLRRRRSMAFIQRNARSIEALQREGHVDPELEPGLAAQALSGMVGRIAYQRFVLDPDDEVDFDALVFTVTRLWANALRLPWPDRDNAIQAST